MSNQFQELLIDQIPRLRSYAMALTRNFADANDLVQSTAERILRFETHFEVGTNFSAWSCRILKNNHISNCRSNRFPHVSLDIVAGKAALPAALTHRAPQEDQIFTQEVIRALNKLSPRLKEIVALVCGGQYTYEEAAAELSISVGTVKSRLWRAREQLKSLLLGDNDDDDPANEAAKRPAGRAWARVEALAS